MLCHKLTHVIPFLQPSLRSFLDINPTSSSQPLAFRTHAADTPRNHLNGASTCTRFSNAVCTWLTAFSGHSMSTKPCMRMGYGPSHL